MSLWEIAATQMSLLANVNRDSKKRPKPFTADDFNPFANASERRKRNALPATPEIMASLKRALESSYRR